MFTKYLDNLLSSDEVPVKCYVVHPGYINSNLHTQTWYAKWNTMSSSWAFQVVYYYVLLL